MLIIFIAFCRKDTKGYKMRKQIVVCMDEKTIGRLKEIKQETGTPISRILEKSFEKSEYNEK